ncbi:MAG: acyl-CoA dehydrogenase family protein [Variovorax sp.]
MAFHLTEEQRMLQDSVRSLMRKVATPDYLRAMDREGRYPYELYEAWVEAGFFRLPFPESEGGLGGSLHDLIVVASEIANTSFDCFTTYTTVMFNALMLHKRGSQAQKRHFLPKVMDGSLRLSVSISEPGAGSDVGAMSTRARPDADGWIVNGQKLWSTAAGARNNVIGVYARTAPLGPAKSSLSLFLIDNDTAGVEYRKLDMLGRRGTGTYEVFFTDVKVGADRLVGEVNRGWDILLSCLQIERLMTSSGYCGSSRRVFEMARDYAKERQQFGKPIGEFQAIAHMLADMQTEVEAAHLLTWNAADKMVRGEDALQAVTMAKLFGSEAYVKAANQGMQILGGYGFTMEYEMQQHFRDSRSTTIGAGSSQMQRNLLANLMGLKVR